MANVKVVSLGTNKELEIPEGCTVTQLLEIADLSPDLEVRINGSKVNGDAPVPSGATAVATAPSVKHG